MVVAALILSGCAVPSRFGPMDSLAPNPVPVDAPAPIAELIRQLEDDRFEKRDAAGAELQRLATTPESQPVVVEALRAAATHSDAEVRSRARAILQAIDRSEGMMRSGTMSYSMNNDRVQFVLRTFADASVELEAKINDGVEELFSGKSMADLARKVSAAARARGYPEEAFTMLPDGTLKMGGSSITIGNDPANHVVQDWAIWVGQVTEDEPGVPRQARGTWRVHARMLAGRGFNAGLRQGDLIAEVDGKKPSSIDGLREALRSPKSIKVLRLTIQEAELKP
jgi:hypothetical protein